MIFLERDLDLVSTSNSKTSDSGHNSFSGCVTNNSGPGGFTCNGEQDIAPCSTFPIELQYSVYTTIFFTTLAIVASFGTVLGNTIFLLAFYLEKSLRRPSHYFFVAIAAANIVNGAYSLPMSMMTNLIGWRLGRLMCTIYIAMDWALGLAIEHILFMLIVDRFLCIRMPRRHRAWRTKGKTILVIALVFVLTFAPSTYSTIRWHVERPVKRCQDNVCKIGLQDPQGKRYFFILLPFFYFCLPTLVVLCMYLWAWLTVRSLKRRDTFQDIKMQRTSVWLAKMPLDQSNNRGAGDIEICSASWVNAFKPRKLGNTQPANMKESDLAECASVEPAATDACANCYCDISAGHKTFEKHGSIDFFGVWSRICGQNHANASNIAVTNNTMRDTQTNGENRDTPDTAGNPAELSSIEPMHLKDTSHSLTAYTDALNNSDHENVGDDVDKQSWPAVVSRNPNYASAGPSQNAEKIDRFVTVNGHNMNVEYLGDSTVDPRENVKLVEIPRIRQMLTKEHASKPLVAKADPTIDANSNAAADNFHPVSSAIDQVEPAQHQSTSQHHIINSLLTQQRSARQLMMAMVLARHSHAEHDATVAFKTMTLMLFPFILLWGPFYALIHAMLYDSSLIRGMPYEVTSWTRYVLGVINPFLYARLDPLVKKTFLRILRLDLRKTESRRLRIRNNRI